MTGPIDPNQPINGVIPGNPGVINIYNIGPQAQNVPGFGQMAGGQGFDAFNSGFGGMGTMGTGAAGSPPVSGYILETMANINGMMAQVTTGLLDFINGLTGGNATSLAQAQQQAGAKPASSNSSGSSNTKLDEETEADGIAYLQDNFKEIDENGDGVISASELNAAKSDIKKELGKEEGKAFIAFMKENLEELSVTSGDKKLGEARYHGLSKADLDEIASQQEDDETLAEIVKTNAEDYKDGKFDGDVKALDKYIKDKQEKHPVKNDKDVTLFLHDMLTHFDDADLDGNGKLTADEVEEWADENDISEEVATEVTEYMAEHDDKLSEKNLKELELRAAHGNDLDDKLKDSEKTKAQQELDSILRGAQAENEAAANKKDDEDED